MNLVKFTIALGAVAVVVAIIGIFAWCFGHPVENNPEPPKLYYTTSAHEEPAAKAVMGSQMWSWHIGYGTSSARMTDCFHPLDIVIDEYLVITDLDTIQVDMSIGYDDVSLRLPKIKNIRVMFWNIDKELDEMMVFKRDDGSYYFNASTDGNEYIYEAQVEYEQGTVSYIMKVKALHI